MNWKAYLGSIVLSLLTVVGCDDDSSPMNDDSSYEWLNSVMLYMPEDSLWMMPGDSVSTNLAVIVTDRNGNTMEGVQVSVSLSNPQLGYIEFLDHFLHDTTNAQGRVEIRYTAVGVSGHEVISAAAGGVGVRDSLVCIAIGSISVGAINITSEVDTLFFTQHETGSTQVTIGVEDTDGNPLQRTRIAIHNETPQLGYFEFTNDALRDTTDEEGLVRLSYTALGDSGDNVFSVTAGAMTVRDTVTFQMLPDVIAVTVSNFHYDWVESQLVFGYEFEAVFTDGVGVPFPGVQLTATPMQGTLDSTLPVTDADGRTTGGVTGILDYTEEICITLSDGTVTGTGCFMGQ